MSNTELNAGIEPCTHAVNTLVFMLFGIGLLMPVMLACNLYQYFAFRGTMLPAQAS